MLVPVLSGDDFNFLSLSIIIPSLWYISFIAWGTLILYPICWKFYTVVDQYGFVLHYGCGKSIYSFASVEQCLHTSNKSFLIMVKDIFNVLVSSICLYFVSDFFINVHQRYWHVIFFSCTILVWLWYWGNIHLIKWLYKYYFLNFWKTFTRIYIIYFSI